MRLFAYGRRRDERDDGLRGRWQRGGSGKEQEAGPWMPGKFKVEAGRAIKRQHPAPNAGSERVAAHSAILPFDNRSVSRPS